MVPGDRVDMVPGDRVDMEPVPEGMELVPEGMELVPEGMEVVHLAEGGRVPGVEEGGSSVAVVVGICTPKREEERDRGTFHKIYHENAGYKRNFITFSGYCFVH